MCPSLFLSPISLSVPHYCCEQLSGMPRAAGKTLNRADRSEGGEGWRRNVAEWWEQRDRSGKLDNLVEVKRCAVSIGPIGEKESWNSLGNGPGCTFRCIIFCHDAYTFPQKNNSTQFTLTSLNKYSKLDKSKDFRKPQTAFCKSNLTFPFPSLLNLLCSFSELFLFAHFWTSALTLISSLSSSPSSYP